MDHQNKYICTTCSTPLVVSDATMMCSSCKKTFPVVDGVPVFGKDMYWGKIKEQELVDMIKDIQEKGFSSFTKEKQKKLDFTYDEDRADWRFFIPLDETSVALDIGSGLGRITIPLSRVCGKVVSCDLSLSRMRFLKERANAEKLHNVDVFVGDIFNLPLKEGSFDLIVMNGVLEWVGKTDKFKNPRDAQRESLRICKKLLKKGGRLYIGIENRAALVYLKAKDHGGLRYTSYMPRFLANIYSQISGKGPYKTYTYTKSGYEKLIRESGFHTLPEFYLPYPGYNLPRVIVPYHDIGGFKFLIKSFKGNTGVVKKFIYAIAQLPIFLRLYRYLFFSFGIIVTND